MTNRVQCSTALPDKIAVDERETFRVCWQRGVGEVEQEHVGFPIDDLSWRTTHLIFDGVGCL